MSKYYPKKLVTIKQIQRDDMEFCHSRHMNIVVISEEEEIIAIPWAKMPSMVIASIGISKPTTYFDWFWHNASEGQKAYLWHGKDASYNYLEPISVS